MVLINWSKPRIVAADIVDFMILWEKLLMAVVVVEKSFKESCEPCRVGLGLRVPQRTTEVTQRANQTTSSYHIKNNTVHMGKGKLRFKLEGNQK